LGINTGRPRWHPPPGNLTAYDYDDEWGNTPSSYTNAACVVGPSLCSDVGNFSVTFTATISGGTFDGSPVFSVFSPTSNYTGGFVGWEGLDPNGVSETVYDEHSGTFSGTMAIVQIGTPPNRSGTSIARADRDQPVRSRCGPPPPRVTPPVGKPYTLGKGQHPTGCCSFL
jgi:hypothetical protein